MKTALTFLSLLSFSVLITSCANTSNEQTTEKEQNTDTAATVRLLQKDDMLSLIAKPTGKLKVINFWATWCGPCVKELPHFEALASNKEVEVHLISLDFANELESKVLPFVKKKGLQNSQLYLLTETDYNAWIDTVAPEWQGDIPATLFVFPENNIRAFAAKEFTEGELETMIAQLMPKQN